MIHSHYYSIFGLGCWILISLSQSLRSFSSKDFLNARVERKYTVNMRLFAFASAIIAAQSLVLPSPEGLPISALDSKQRPLITGEDQAATSRTEEQRAAAVKDVFRYAWDGYFTTCKGEDELLPVTNTCGNPRNQWGASAVDALSTALIMGIEPIVAEILDFIPTIDFQKTESEVSLFETTIRYLAGLLSGYDLLKGPLSHLADNSTAVEVLLSQSISLADTLKYAFDTPTGIPYNILYPWNRGSDGSTTNGLATTGTLVLEWQHLSDLTGDSTYGELARKAESYLLAPRPASNVPFPGLLGTRLSIADGSFVDASGGWGGSDDSYYEYLIKMYVYDSKRFANYRDQWMVAVDSTIKYLTSHPSSRPDLTFLSRYQNKTLVDTSEHLTCFDGGNFLLGGQVLGRPDYIDFGLQLVKGCHETYVATATRIGPEAFGWNSSTVPDDQKAFFNTSGFYITNSFYDLRPEVIESYYYAYRVTGDRMYQDWAWDAFLAINETCKVGKGYSSVRDVNAKGGGGFANEQESFLFAEVLKYTYMIHSSVGSPSYLFICSCGQANALDRTMSSRLGTREGISMSLILRRIR